MPTDYKDKGLNLLKRGQKGIIHAIFSRFGLVLLMLVVQFLILFGILRWFGKFLPHIWGGTVLLTFVMVLYLLNSRLDPPAKITWLIVVMLLPVFGVLLFVYTKSEIGHRALKMRIDQIIKDTKESIPQSPEVMQKFSKENPGAAALARYMQRSGCHPVYEMLKQLEAAEHFIFMEYFIVDEGLMWGKILEILARKAAEGVEVRVMYDGTCEFALLPRDYPKRWA